MRFLLCGVGEVFAVSYGDLATRLREMEDEAPTPSMVQIVTLNRNIPNASMCEVMR